MTMANLTMGDMQSRAKPKKGWVKKAARKERRNVLNAKLADDMKGMSHKPRKSVLYDKSKSSED